MSFFTAPTGLNGAQSDISATSDNIANVNTTGLKDQRQEFDDILRLHHWYFIINWFCFDFSKSVKQQFTQGNITSSLNVLDITIQVKSFILSKTVSSG